MEEKAQVATYFTIPIFGSVKLRKKLNKIPTFFRFFIASTLLVGFEFATELMYPVPEAASCSVLNTFIYLFSVVYTLIFGALFDSIGYVPTNIVIVVLLVISSLLIYFIRPNLKRREANLNK